ncbi:hypothetical protein GIB67_034400, partial [Kingdonia uniflora]
VSNISNQLSNFSASIETSNTGISILKSIQRLRIGFINLPIIDRSSTDSASLSTSSVPPSLSSAATPFFFVHSRRFIEVEVFARFARRNC